MKTLVRLKKLLTLAGAALFASAASAVTITIDRVQQRYPWNNLVDIDYTLDGDVADSAIFEVKAVVDGTEYVAHKFKNQFGRTAGSHRVTWNTEGDGVRLFTKNATVGLSITIEAPAGYDTVIFDLDAGTYEKMTLGSENYASLNTDEYKTNKLAMRVIPAQTFTMIGGSHTSGIAPHEATVSSFLIGVFEVTQAQWAKLTGNWPSFYSGNTECRDTRPVERINWDMIRGTAAEGIAWPEAGHTVSETSFMALLRAKFGGAVEFDLPTEAQWCAAAQAGYTTKFGYLGDTYDADTILPNIRCRENAVNNLDWAQGSWYDSGSGAVADSTVSTAGTDVGTAAVGTYASNPYGLYDVIGNVFEWVLDKKVNPNSTEPEVNPVGEYSSTGDNVMRGGSWAHTAASYQASIDSRGHNPRNVVWATNSNMSWRFGLRVAAPLVD